MFDIVQSLVRELKVVKTALPGVQTPTQFRIPMETILEEKESHPNLDEVEEIVDDVEYDDGDEQEGDSDEDENYEDVVFDTHVGIIQGRNIDTTPWIPNFASPTLQTQQYTNVYDKDPDLGPVDIQEDIVLESDDVIDACDEDENDESFVVAAAAQSEVENSIEITEVQQPPTKHQVDTPPIHPQTKSYNKLSAEKLRFVLYSKGYTQDISKLKKQDLLNILEEMK